MLSALLLVRHVLIFLHVLIVREDILLMVQIVYLQVVNVVMIVYNVMTITTVLNVQLVFHYQYLVNVFNVHLDVVTPVMLVILRLVHHVWLDLSLLLDSVRDVRLIVEYVQADSVNNVDRDMSCFKMTMVIFYVKESVYIPVWSVLNRMDVLHVFLIIH